MSASVCKGGGVAIDVVTGCAAAIGGGGGSADGGVIVSSVHGGKRAARTHVLMLVVCVCVCVCARACAAHRGRDTVDAVDQHCASASLLAITPRGPRTTGRRSRRQPCNTQLDIHSDIAQMIEPVMCFISRLF